MMNDSLFEMEISVEHFLRGCDRSKRIIFKRWQKNEKSNEIIIILSLCLKMVI